MSIVTGFDSHTKASSLTVATKSSPPETSDTAVTCSEIAGSGTLSLVSSINWADVFKPRARGYGGNDLYYSGFDAIISYRSKGKLLGNSYHAVNRRVEFLWIK